LYTAKHFGHTQGKWIALLINDEGFPSLSFHRDIFNSDSRQKVKQLIKKNFILLRKNSSCEESIRILQNYKLVEHPIPVFMIIDSLTGELKKNFGDTRNLTLKSVIRELKKYSSTADKELKYTSDVEDSDGDDECPVITFNPSSSNSTSQSSSSQTSQKPQTKKVLGANCSDSEESFKSLDSDDVDASDNEEPEGAENFKPEESEPGNSQPKLAADSKEPETSRLDH